MIMIEVTAARDGTPIIFNANEFLYCAFDAKNECTQIALGKGRVIVYCKETPQNVAELIRANQQEQQP